MKLLKRKTRKAFRKSLNKIAKKHGSKIAAGLVGSLASTLASTDAPRGRGKRSNLDELSQWLSEAMMAPRDKKSRRELRTKHRLSKKKTGAPKKSLRAMEQAMS